MNTDWSPFPDVMLIDNTAKSIKDHWIAACGVTIKHLSSCWLHQTKEGEGRQSEIELDGEGALFKL